jgi:hypothetical protein
MENVSEGRNDIEFHVVLGLVEFVQ